MAAVWGGVSATPGILLKLKEQLDFIQKCKNILEMKRDHLGSEVNKMLRDLSSSSEDATKSLTEAYDYLKISYSTLGYSGLSSVASSTGFVEVGTSVGTTIGVEVPMIAWLDAMPESQPALENLSEPTAQQAAEKLLLSLNKWLELAELEASIERISTELMITNRKVNALQNIVIPNIAQLIVKIEEQLEEENLEDFFNAKKTRSIIRGKRQ